MFGRTWGRVGVLFPGRMGPPGAASWTLIGITLALTSLARTSEVSIGRFRAKALVPILGPLTASISTLSIIGYLYGASRLYTIPTVTIIAFQTATFIFAVSVALVVTAPEYGPVRIIAEDSAAGILARRILPALIVLPIVIGFLRLSGERRGLYDLAFGVGISIKYPSRRQSEATTIAGRVNDFSGPDAVAFQLLENLSMRLRKLRLQQLVKDFAERVFAFETVKFFRAAIPVQDYVVPPG